VEESDDEVEVIDPMGEEDEDDEKIEVPYVLPFSPPFRTSALISASY
jgi:hypothetical protein